MKGLLIVGALLILLAENVQAQTTYNADSYILNGSPSAGPGLFSNGNGDNATFSTVNSEIDSWWGLGIKSQCCTNYSGYGIVFDARSGSMFAQGHVGIGTAAPNAALQISGQNYNATTVPLFRLTDTALQSNIAIDNGAGTDAFRLVTGNGQAPRNIEVQAGVFSYQFVLNTNGNVGIGTSSPTAKLDINGSVKINGSGASMTYPDGTVQATAWNGTTCGGDYAESVDVTGERSRYEPGDVLVIDPKAKGKFVKSAKPYSTMVMGIFSTKPGLTGRRQTTPKSEDEVPMAMMGIVPTKVSTENGSIEPGDLLVTSSTPGYAMKGTDRSMMLGAVVGKALEGLVAGKGVIEVGVTLQ